MKTKLQLPPHSKARCYDVDELAAVVRIPKSTVYGERGSQEHHEGRKAPCVAEGGHR